MFLFLCSRVITSFNRVASVFQDSTLFPLIRRPTTTLFSSTVPAGLWWLNVLPWKTLLKTVRKGREQPSLKVLTAASQEHYCKFTRLSDTRITLSTAIGGIVRSGVWKLNQRMPPFSLENFDSTARFHTLLFLHQHPMTLMWTVV